MKFSISKNTSKYFVLWLTLVSLSVGATDWQFDVNIRERLTYLDAVEFDSTSGEAGLFWTQRLIAETKYNISPNLTIGGGLISALQEGVDESPVERNNLDIYTAFITHQSEKFNVTLGRQTLKLGSQRLIGWREGTNVRRTWQGITSKWQHTNDWESNWFALELISVEPNGIFNDQEQHANRLAGAYHTVDLTNIDWGQNSFSGVDFYYLYTNRDNRRTIEGQENQLRHSFGTRYFGAFDRWFWDWEGVVQTGRHGQNKIEAWTLATKTGYRFDSSHQSEIMVSLNVASGDKSNGDNKLETFDALYPRGDYFSGAAILGPANFYNAHVYFFTHPNKDLRLGFSVNFYWRLESTDGVYGPPGNLITMPNENTSKDVNLAYSTSISYSLNENINMELLMTYSRPREFLRESGADDDTLFIEYTINWKLH